MPMCTCVNDSSVTYQVRCTDDGPNKAETVLHTACMTGMFNCTIYVRTYPSSMLIALSAAHYCCLLYCMSACICQVSGIIYHFQHGELLAMCKLWGDKSDPKFFPGS